MPVTVKVPYELQALLAKMLSAREHGVEMSVWDTEIKAVENAIKTINAIRRIEPK